MNTYTQVNIFPSGTVLNTNLNSPVIDLYTINFYSIQIVFTGTPTGTFKLQVSDDPADSAATNWTDLASSTFTVAAAGNVMWNVSDVSNNFARIVYTDGSSATSTAIITVSTVNRKGV